MKPLKKIILIFFAFSILSLNCFSADMPTPWKEPIDYVKWYPNHYWNGLKSVGDVKYHRTLLITGAVAIPIAFLLDDAVQDYLQKRHFYSQSVSRIGDLYGHRWGYIGAVGLVTVTGFARGQSIQKTFSNVELIAEAVLTTDYITQILKEITHRERPNGENFHSFPSGHVSSSFTLAACLNEIYGKKVGIPAYAMAAFVASHRINDNKHYLSDVVAGAVVGTIVGKSFSREHHRMWNLQAGQNDGVSTISFSYQL